MPRLATTLLALALLVLAPAAASAAPRLDKVVDLTGPPGQMTIGPDGNAWVLFTGAGGENLARIKPNGKVKEYAPPDLVSPTGIAKGPGGNLWATRNGGVVRIPVDDPENAVATDIGGMGAGQGITKGPQGKMWAASDDQLISFEPNDPAGANLDTIDGMSARGIDEADGKLWIADFLGGDIVRAKPNGDFKRFNVGGTPQQVADGPDDQVAYSNQGTDPQTVGRIVNGDVKKTKDPNADPFGIELAGDGNWWIGQFNKPGKLGILSPSGNLRQFGDLPNNALTRYLAAGGGVVYAGIENRDEVAIIKGVN
jgi:streptogramin lyase